MSDFFYHTQLLSRRDQFDKNGGIAANFSVHYMGSAEFEFGALPKSLRRVAARLDEYQMFTHEIDDDHPAIRVFCLPDQIEKIRQQLDLLVEKEIPFHTKENLWFYRNYHRTEKDSYHQVDVWWDIDHDFFVTIEKRSMKVLFTALNNLKKKWENDG